MKASVRALKSRYITAKTKRDRAQAELHAKAVEVVDLMALEATAKGEFAKALFEVEGLSFDWWLKNHVF